MVQDVKLQSRLTAMKRFTLFCINLKKGHIVPPSFPLMVALSHVRQIEAYISNIDQQEWFDINQGYMICRYSQQRLLNTDAYAAVLNDGSSSNTVGLRIRQQ